MMKGKVAARDMLISIDSSSAVYDVPQTGLTSHCVWYIVIGTKKMILSSLVQDQEQAASDCSDNSQQWQWYIPPGN